MGALKRWNSKSYEIYTYNITTDNQVVAAFLGNSLSLSFSVSTVCLSVYFSFFLTSFLLFSLSLTFLTPFDMATCTHVAQTNTCTHKIFIEHTHLHLYTCMYTLIIFISERSRDEQAEMKEEEKMEQLEKIEIFPDKGLL